MAVDIVMLLVVILLVAWYYLKESFRDFEKANVPYVPPVIPFGNTMKSFFRRQHVVKDIDLVYNLFPGARYFGFYQLSNKHILIKDLELIKKIMVKDFDHFTDHQTFVDEEIDPLFAKNLFASKGQRWKVMRTALSPAFTSSKLRNMHGLITDAGQHIAQYLLGEIDKERSKNERGALELETKDLTMRYTSEVIASIAFGFKIDPFLDRENDFFIIGKKTGNFDGIAMLKFFVYVVAPKLVKIFNLSIFSKETCDFYRSLVIDTIKYREKENIHRPDMIQLLMQAKKGTLKYDNPTEVKEDVSLVVSSDTTNEKEVTQQWDDDDLTAQAIIFIIAGQETTSNLLSIIIHELVCNPDIQERLRQEVDEQETENISYEAILKMQYLDMVINETLRKWPPAIVFDRSCTKDYELGQAQSGYGETYTIKSGELIWIPIFSIQNDPTYWPNPEKFDPERFSEENKKNIHPFTFMPFGNGPRICIGSRLALLVVKLVMYHLMKKFRFEACSKTQIPLKLATNTFDVKGENGTWIKYVPR